MALLDRMRASRLDAMKAKDKITNAALTVFVGDLESDSHRGIEITDAYIIKKLKKAIQNNEENERLSGDSKFLVENDVLAQFLPKQLTEEELQSTIEHLIAEQENANIGSVMKALKENHDGLFDGKQASKTIKELL